MEKLRPYFDIPERVFAGLPDGDMKFRFGQWLAGSPEQKLALETKYPAEIVPVKRMIESEKRMMLGEDSLEVEERNTSRPYEMRERSMQQIAMDWHIHTKPYSLEDYEYLQRIIDEVDIDNIVPVEPRGGLLPIYMP